MRLIGNLFLIFAFLLLNITPSHASVNWYVRDGGGTKTQCTGTTNAVYLGSGTGQPCAYNNPMYALGAGCGNYGGSSCTVAPTMGVGDTLFISGDSDINPGQQAQYPIGYDATGVITPSNSGNCTPTGSLNCTMANVPVSGSIVGTGVNRPQLWGREKVNQIVEANNNGVTLNNLEITQHSSCMYRVNISGTKGAYPINCNEASPPYGDWAIEGVYTGGSNVTIENSWIHGLAENGTDSTDLSNYLSFNNIISGNAQNGDGPGGINGGGGTTTLNNTTWDHDIIVHNGCGEVKPMHSSNPYDTANYYDCHDAGIGSQTGGLGQGDGLGCQANNCICSGYMNITNGDISFNTQDGVDWLHCSSVGNVYMSRTRAEGNEGQQIKFNNANANIENNEIIGDCYYYNGQTFSFPEPGSSEICRAGGDAIRLVITGGIYNIVNSTLLATGPGIIEYEGSCSGSLNIFNNNVVGGWNTPAYGNNAKATFIDPECSSGSVAMTEDYNHVWNTSNQAQCAGAHDQCGDTNAGATTTLTTSMIGQTAYYQGQDLGHLLYPDPAGSLVHTANSSLVLSGTSNDFNNFVRASSTYSMGSYTLNSQVVNGGTCFASSECASSNCVNNVCTNGSCSANGSGCSTGATCCSGLCQTSVCVACESNGTICSTNSNCCSGICNAGICSASSCTSNGGACTIGATCCSTLCQGSLCVSCETTGGSCSTGANCCSGTCCSGLCALSCGGGSTNIVTQLAGQCSTSGKVGF